MQVVVLGCSEVVFLQDFVLPEHAPKKSLHKVNVKVYPHDAPPPLGKPVVTVSSKDANLMHDMQIVGTI